MCSTDKIAAGSPWVASRGVGRGTDGETQSSGSAAVPLDELDLRLEIEELEGKLDQPLTVDSPNAREYRAGLRRILDELYDRLREVEA